MHRNFVVYVILVLMVTTGYAAEEDSYRVIIKFGITVIIIAGIGSG